MVKVYGPYLRKDGRKHVCIIEDGKRTTKSYPKYLMELKLGRSLLGNETVDHIDTDFTNDEENNLQVLSRSEHVRIDLKRLTSRTFACPMCNKEFEVSGPKRLRNLYYYRMIKKAGPFCSRRCSGLYGALVQNNKVEKLPSIKLEKEYYTIKSTQSLHGETHEVQGANSGKPDDGNPELS